LLAPVYGWFTEGFEPRHQRGVKARRNCLWWNAGGGLLPPAFRLCFQHRLGLFLHEQGDSVRALNYVMPKARRDGLVTDDVLRDVAMQFTALPLNAASVTLVESATITSTGMRTNSAASAGSAS
jgi:hypothetical protein